MGEQGDEAKREKVRVIPLHCIDDFPDHPFLVKDDESMEQLMHSIKMNGVLNPVIARRKEGERYELISGHRRKHACERLGIEVIPIIVRELSREEAIIEMAEGIDTGDMILKGSFEITENDNYGDIHDRLATLGGSLCVDAMKKIFAGEATYEKQDDSLSNYAYKIEKADRAIDFTASTAEIVNKIRAFAPIPGAEAKLPSGKVKITSAKAISEEPTGEAGTVSALSAKGVGLLVINTVDGKLSIEKLIPEGKKEMTAGDFIRGRRITETDRFESVGE